MVKICISESCSTLRVNHIHHTTIKLSSVCAPSRSTATSPSRGPSRTPGAGGRSASPSTSASACGSSPSSSPARPSSDGGSSKCLPKFIYCNVCLFLYSAVHINIVRGFVGFRFIQPLTSPFLDSTADWDVVVLYLQRRAFSHAQVLMNVNYVNFRWASIALLLLGHAITCGTNSRVKTFNKTLWIIAHPTR